MNDRALRLAAAIQAELAGIIIREVKDPRVHAAGLLTVTRLTLTDDLRQARVYVSFVDRERTSLVTPATPAESAQVAAEAAIKGLGRASGFLRGEIGRRLALRRAPELRFVHDRTAQQVAHIEDLLRPEGEGKP